MEPFKTHSVSVEELEAFGLEFMAYVRPVVMNDGRKAQGIYAADGSLLTVMDDRDSAFVTLKRHEIMPQSVH